MIFDARYLKGAVKIMIKGPMPERFINLCMTEEIVLWSIERQEDDLVAWITLGDFFRIRSLVRRSRTQVKVLSFLGFPFAVKRAKGRRWLLVGAVLFLIILYMLSSYIWFIEITGLKEFPDDKIIQIISQNGLKRGSPKEQIDIKKIEKEILLNVPEISWVGISFNGTRAVIEVVEKTLPRIENKTPANLVASKDGVIEEIIALAGLAAVKKGDTVKKGDILIKGISPAITGDGENIDLNINGNSGLSIITVPQIEVRAKGIIKAKVWYESYAEVKRILDVRERTGNKQTAAVLKIGEKEFNLKPASALFPEYEIQSVSKRFGGWRNSLFDVEITINIINYHEMKIHQEEVSFEQASDEARAEALNKVQNLIPENAQILTRNFDVINTADYERSNIVRVKVNVETIEDIGEIVELN